MIAAAAGLALLAAAAAPMPVAVPPPRVENAAGATLTFVERRGDYHLRQFKEEKPVLSVGRLNPFGLPPRAYAITADGRFGAKVSGDTATVWDLRDGRVVRVITSTGTNMDVVAISPDGARLATAGGRTQFWDLGSGALLWSSKEEAAQLWFSMDGKRLMGWDGSVAYRVWDAANGRLVWQGRNHGKEHDPDDYDYSTVLTPDGRRSIELINVKDATMYDLDTGATLRAFPIPGELPFNLVLSPGGDRLGVIGEKQLFVFDVASGRKLATVARPGGTGESSTSLTLTDDPRFAILWEHDELIGWDLAAGKARWRARTSPGERYADSRFAGKEAVFFTGEQCGVRRLSDGAVRWRRAGCTRGVASPFATRILIERGPSAVDIVDAGGNGTSLVPPPAAQGPVGSIFALAVSGDGRRVAGLAYDQSIWVWEAGGGGRKLVDPPDRLSDSLVRFLPDGRLAIFNRATENKKRRIYRYDATRNTVEVGAELGPFGPFDSEVLVGDRVILDEIWKQQNVRKVVDLTGRSPPYQLPEWTRPPRRPFFVLLTQTLRRGAVTAALTRGYLVADHKLHAWDLATGKLLAEAPSAPEEASAVLLTPDEKRLLILYEKGPPVVHGTVDVKGTVDVTPEHLLGPKSGVFGAAISPDSKLAVIAASEGLSVWRLSDGERVATVDFSAGREAPTALAFTPDGTTLWVGTTLGNLHRFSVRR